MEVKEEEAAVPGEKGQQEEAGEEKEAKAEEDGDAREEAAGGLGDEDEEDELEELRSHVLQLLLELDDTREISQRHEENFMELQGKSVCVRKVYVCIREIGRASCRERVSSPV